MIKRIAKGLADIRNGDVLSLEETDYELMLSPYIDSIRTASKHSKDVATFSGMYTMKAKAGQKEYIFGSHVHSFSSEID